MDEILLDYVINVITALNDPTTIYGIGMVYGATLIDKEDSFVKCIAERPLTEIFNRSFVGIIYGLGSIIATIFLPEQYHFIVPTLLLLSIFYYKFIKKNNNNGYISEFAEK